MYAKDELHRDVLHRITVPHPDPVLLSCSIQKLEHVDIRYQWRVQSNEENIEWANIKNASRDLLYRARPKSRSASFVCLVVYPNKNITLTSQVLTARFTVAVVTVPSCLQVNLTKYQCDLYSSVTIQCNVLHTQGHNQAMNYVWISPVALSGKRSTITFTSNAEGTYRCAASTARDGIVVSDPINLYTATDYCFDRKNFCTHLSARGNCLTQDYVLQKCPVSCGMCEANTSYPFVKVFNNTLMKLGATVMLRCMASPPQRMNGYLWFKNGNELQTDVNTLQVALTEENLGQYQCHAQHGDQYSDLLEMALCCNSRKHNLKHFNETCTEICTYRKMASKETSSECCHKMSFLKYTFGLIVLFTIHTWV